MLSDDDPVNSSAKYLDGLGEGIGVVQEGRRLFSAKQILDVVQRYGFVPTCSVQDMLNLRELGGGRICEICDEQEIGVQVIVVECAYRLARCSVLADKHDIRRPRLDEEL